MSDSCVEHSISGDSGAPVKTMTDSNAAGRFMFHNMRSPYAPTTGLRESGHSCWSGNSDRKTLVSSSAWLDTCAAATFYDSSCAGTFELDHSAQWCGCGVSGTSNDCCSEVSSDHRYAQSSDVYSLLAWSLRAARRNCWSSQGNRKSLDGATVDRCAAAAFNDNECSGNYFEYDTANAFCGCGTGSNLYCNEESDQAREWKTSNIFSVAIANEKPGKMSCVNPGQRDIVV